MFLMINSKRYTCGKRLKTANSVRFLSVAPAVEEFTGKVKLFRDDGFPLSEDSFGDYTRNFMSGAILTLTNEPEPAPVTPTPTAEQEMAAAIREGVDSV